MEFVLISIYVHMYLFTQAVMESKEEDDGQKIFTAEQKKKMSYVPQDRLLYMFSSHYGVCIYTHY